MLDISLRCLEVEQKVSIASTLSKSKKKVEVGSFSRRAGRGEKVGTAVAFVTIDRCRTKRRRTIARRRLHYRLERLMSQRNSTSPDQELMAISRFLRHLQRKKHNIQNTERSYLDFFSPVSSINLKHVLLERTTIILITRSDR